MGSVHYTQVPFQWKPLVVGGKWPNHPLSSRIEKRIHFALAAWEGTPYVSGQQMPGVGADCVRYFAAFVDTMYGYRRVQPDRLPQDYSMHTRAGAISVMRDILRLYPEMRPVRGSTLEPGDVLVVGPQDGGPSHCMMVGSRENTLWHAVKPHVCWTGWGLMKGHQKVFRAYRFKDRGTWGLYAR